MYVYDFDVFLTGQIVEARSAVLSLGQLCEDHGHSYEWTSCQEPHLIKNGKKYDATRRMLCLALFQACQPDFPARLRVRLQHRYRRTQRQMILHQVQQPHEVGVRAVEHWGTSCKMPKKPKTKITMRTSIEHGEAHCVIWNGSRNSLKIFRRRSFRFM